MLSPLEFLTVVFVAESQSPFKMALFKCGSGGSAGWSVFGGSAVRSPPLLLVTGVVSLGTSPTLPGVKVSDWLPFEVVVVRGAVGAEWQPRFRQSAPGQLLSKFTTTSMTVCEWMESGTLSERFECIEKRHTNPVHYYYSLKWAQKSHQLLSIIITQRKLSISQNTFDWHNFLYQPKGMFKLLYTFIKQIWSLF